MPPARKQTAKTAEATPSERTGTGPAEPGQAPTGWKLGNAAPSDQYAPVGPDGEPDLKKVSSKPVPGYGVQLATKGAPVTRAVLAALGKDDPDVPAQTTIA